jgi:hypothetical protein
MKKYNHDAADFFEALDSNRDELLALVSKHIDKGMDQVSRVSLDIIKDVKKKYADLPPDELNVKIFLHGMMFQQALNTKKLDDLKDMLPGLGGLSGRSPLDLIKGLPGLGSSLEKMLSGAHEASKERNVKKKKLPFTTDDLMKSVKSEMESKK